MAEDSTFKVEKMTAENYHAWKFNMKMYLIGTDLWEIVSGTNAQKKAFKKREI